MLDGGSIVVRFVTSPPAPSANNGISASSYVVQQQPQQPSSSFSSSNNLYSRAPATLLPHVLPDLVPTGAAVLPPPLARPPSAAVSYIVSVSHGGQIPTVASGGAAFEKSADQQALLQFQSSV